MLTPKNVVMHELIGLEFEIIENKNKSLVGIKGKIVDETKNMFTIKTDQGEKKIIKNGCKFKIRIDDAYVEVDGSLLSSQPEKRTKKTFQKKRI